MRKQEFLSNLRYKLACLPKYEVEDRISFYSEMIDDRIEEGIPEAVAVAGIGSPASIAAQIISEIPLARIVKDRPRSKEKMSAFTVILLILGFPIWFSLLAAIFSVVLSLYLFLWAIIISLWATAFSVLVCAPVGILLGVAFIVGGNALPGSAIIGAALVCFGISVFMFVICKWLTKASVYLTKRIALWIIRRR